MSEAEVSRVFGRDKASSAVSDLERALELLPEYLHGYVVEGYKSELERLGKERLGIVI